MPTEVIEHADGIYFGMPEAEYHADPALGSTDLKRLLMSPSRWWAQSLFAQEWRGNLELEDDKEDSAGKRFGRAVHVKVLEPWRFDECYFTPEDPPEEYPTTIEQLRAAVEARWEAGIDAGLGFVKPVKSASKTEWLKACNTLGIQTMDGWKAAQAELAAGREELSRRWRTTISLIGRMLDAPRDDLGGKSQREVFLKGGYSEVSVFWTDDRGIRLKCRIDYLRPKATLDVKTYGAREDQEPITAFVGAVSNYAYDMQGSHYIEGRQQIGRLLEERKVAQFIPVAGEDGVTIERYEVDLPDEDQLKFLAKVAAERSPKWAWLGVQTMGMPETDVFEWDQGLIYQSAAYQLAAAKDKFVSFRDTYGMDSPWVSNRGLIVLTDMVFEASGRARYMTSRGEERWKL